MHAIKKPNSINLIFQRIIALLEIGIVAAISKLFGTADGTIAAILLLVLHRRTVLIQMMRSLISWQSRLKIALLFTVVIWILILALPQLLSHVGLPRPDYTSFAGQIQDNPAALISILLKVWTTVAFGEEILGRVFLIDRFETILKGIPGSTQLSVILASILFGLAHEYQGPGGIILTTIIGLILGEVYLFQKRSIWTNVVVHGMVDTIAMLLLFFGVKFL
jgi:hypothetical protein